MRFAIVSAFAVSFAACLASPQEDLGSTTQVVAVTPGHCPDPTDCSVLNGGGIYTEENGHLGIGSDEYVIARFVNEVDDTGTPFVAWEGRSRIVGGGYGTNGGAILYAQYTPAGGEPINYNVTHATEIDTVPIFTLRSATNSSDVFNVTGDQLYNLTLVLKTTNGERAFFTSTLFFKPISPVLATVPISGTARSFQRYALFYYDGETDGIPTAFSYCKRAPAINQPDGPRDDDYAVFQHGIDVDPLTGKTSFGRDSLTISCSGGAIATVMMWGYPYQGLTKTTETVFEAAIHMKRASYCGDVTSYTQAGTRIFIDDIVPIHSEPRITNTNVEARWGRWPDGHVGALCVNPTRERHPGLLYPPTGAGLPFEGWCHPDDGSPDFQIPVCAVVGKPKPTVMSDSANLRVL